MIEEICADIHNYFIEDSRGGFYHLENATFTIENGAITLPFLVPGQYFLILGSKLNDGVHQYALENLADETFSGQIYEMRVPKMLLALSGEIDAWIEQYGSVMNSPYQSESFGGYSYTKASSGSDGNSGSQNGADWRKVFGSRLNQWRKIA